MVEQTGTSAIYAVPNYDDLYMARLQGPFIRLVGSEVKRIEAQNAEFGYPAVDLNALRADGSESTKALLEAAESHANGFVDSQFSGEIAFGSISSEAVGRVIASHPTASVRLLLDMDGTVAPRITPDFMLTKDGESMIFRPALPTSVAIQAEAYGLSWTAEKPGDRTLNVVPFTTRPGNYIDAISNQIERACDFANGNLVDRTRAMSTHMEEPDRERFEENLSYQEAMLIVAILHPDLPSLDPETDRKLREDMLWALAISHNPDALPDVDQVKITKTVASFLKSLDGWSREKIPAFAQLLQNDINTGEDIVYVYADDGMTPSLLEHERLVCAQLSEGTKSIVDARFRLFDDPEIGTEGTVARVALAILKERHAIARRNEVLYALGNSTLREL